MSTEKKYQLFISSTYEDLKGARDEVIKAILSMYHIPIGMEMFSADDAEQWDTIKETIDNSDYYVLIIGHRYGSETKQGISYTEKEFDYARKKKIPVYTFVRNRNVATLPQERDAEPGKATKLDAFIKKAQATMVDFWDTPGDLGQKVSIAMMKAFTRRPRTGWVKSDQAASPETLKELTTLSRENRQLKEENERLRLLKKTSPDLQVLFNGKEDMEITMSEEYDSTKLVSVLTPELLNSQHPDVINHFNHGLLKTYNSWILGNPEKVEEYNRIVTQLEKGKKSLTKFNLSLINRGTQKANDINVKIKFPDRLFIFSDKASQHLPDFTALEDLPPNPLILAINEYQTKKRKPKEEIDRGFGLSRLPIKTSISENLKLRSSHYSIEVENTIIKFYCRTLLHTQTAEDLDDLNFYIFPLLKGIYTAQIEVICEEFVEPYNYDIPITVN